MQSVMGIVVACSVTGLLVAMLAADDRQAPLDPAGWGSDHVGKPVQEFVSGDQCLFCHRKDIGPDWPKNRHGLTIRVATGESLPEQALRANDQLRDAASAVEHLLGTGNHRRFLKSSKHYGRLDVLSVKWSRDDATAAGDLSETKEPHWDTHLFGDACAGCHTTGVDSSTGQFTAISLDCVVCHADPPEAHTEDASLVRLSPNRETSARETMSICGQCHLRGGRSKSSKHPYPHNFIPGDNLFRDFKVDLSTESIQQLDPLEGHIFENMRDVVLLGRDDTTCLSCHDVHQQSTDRHERLSDAQLCWQCHSADRPKSVRKTNGVHNTTCDY